MLVAGARRLRQDAAVQEAFEEISDGLDQRTPSMCEPARHRYHDLPEDALRRCTTLRRQ
jgi:hypothetical protein